MVASSIIEEAYSNPEEYAITIIQTTDPKGKRFNFELDISVFKNVEYLQLTLNTQNPKYNKDLSDTILRIRKRHFTFFIGFLEQHPLNIFFAKTLNKTGTIICLAPDGTKPYGKITKMALFSRIKMTLSNYRFLFINKLYVYSFSLIDWNYGRMKEIDELWVFSSKGLCNSKIKKIKLINLLTTVSSRNIVSRVFNFKPSYIFKDTNQVIFYINQPFNKQEIYDFEIEVLDAIKKANYGRSLYIKLHPKTSSQQRERYKNYLHCYFIEDNAPAELYIAHLSNSLIISFWSAALLVNNSTCIFYWLHPLLTKKGLMINWLAMANPVDHIQEIDDLSQIKHFS